MVSTFTSRSARENERGAAMFICLMVILILSAIGTFALTNAHYELQASGFTRQRTLSQEMAAFGGGAVANEISSGNKVKGYYGLIANAGKTAAQPVDERCTSLGTYGATTPAPPCYTLKLPDIEKITGMTADRLVRPPDLTTNTPGSYGLSTMSGGFRAELTEPTNVSIPMQGYALSGPQQGAAPAFYDVTITSLGVVFPDDNLNGVIDYSLGEGRSAVFTSGRAHVIIGPIL